MSAFNLVGPTYQAQSIYQNAEECINWYIEVDQNKADGERGKYTLYPTPGSLLRLTLDNPAAIRGMRPLPGGGTAIVVAGNIVYIITSAFVATRIGLLNTSTGPVSITDNGTSAYLTDGGYRYYYTWGTLTFGTLTDGAFTGANMCDAMDNYIVYNNPNSNQWGCTNVGSIVSGGLNFASTLTASGNVVGVIVNKRESFILSEYTGEAWGDVGAFPFPFQCIPGSSTQHGCMARGSISRLGESFAYLSQDTRGNGIVVMMNGYSPLRISTHAMEYALKQYPVISDAIACTYQINGHEFYELTFPSGDETWVFDLATQLWHKKAWMDARGQLHRSRTNCMMNFAGKVLVGDYQNGKIYSLESNVYTDNGAPIKRLRRTVHVANDDLRRQFFNRLQVQFQPGVGLQSGQGSNPKAMLRWSNDGGSTWSGERWTGIGAVGKYKNRAVWRKLGSYSRDRVYEVSVTDPVNAVVVSANMEGAEAAN